MQFNFNCISTFTARSVCSASGSVLSFDDVVGVQMQKSKNIWWWLSSSENQILSYHVYFEQSGADQITWDGFLSIWTGSQRNTETKLRIQSQSRSLWRPYVLTQSVITKSTETSDGLKVVILVWGGDRPSYQLPEWVKEGGSYSKRRRKETDVKRGRLQTVTDIL